MDDTYDSEVVGTANGTLAFGIVPETFNSRIVQDSFGQAQADPFGASTPGNARGPELFLDRPGPHVAASAARPALLGCSVAGRTPLTRPARWTPSATTAGIALGRRASPNAASFR